MRLFDRGGAAATPLITSCRFQLLEQPSVLSLLLIAPALPSRRGIS